MTKFTEAQIEMLERRITLTTCGTEIKNVMGDVAGNVRGNVAGYVGGDVGGSVEGDAGGNVGGNVEGTVKGNVAGNVKKSCGVPITLNVRGKPLILW